MKKTTTTSGEVKSARLTKLENKVRRAEMKLANTEAKLVKRNAKLAAAREAYAMLLAAETEQARATSGTEPINGDGADADDD